MNLNINSNFDKMNDNLWSKKKPYQIVCIILAFSIAIIVTLVLSPHIGSTATSYVVIFLVLPLAYLGFYNKNGMDFLSHLKIKKSNIDNGKLTYRTQLKTQSVVVSNNRKKRNKRRRR